MTKASQSPAATWSAVPHDPWPSLPVIGWSSGLATVTAALS